MSTPVLTRCVYSRRREFLQLHPFPSDQVPTLSFGSFTTKAGAMCSSTQKHMQDKYGALSDGLVPLRDAFIPGSAVVIVRDFIITVTYLAEFSACVCWLLSEL